MLSWYPKFWQVVQVLQQARTIALPTDLLSTSHSLAQIVSSEQAKSLLLRLVHSLDSSPMMRPGVFGDVPSGFVCELLDRLMKA